MSGFTADTNAMQDHGAAFGPVGEQIAGIYTKLLGRLNSAGDCWGDDEAGRQFAKQYVPGAENALAAVQGASEGVASVKRAVDSWAQAYQSVENA